MIQKPKIEEYLGFNAKYIELIGDEELVITLHKQQEELTLLLNELTDEQADYRYAPGKWSLKEVLGHIVDTERIMGYRLLRIARGDKTPLAGFDENDFVNGAVFSLQSVAELLEDYTAVRRATLTLFRGIPDEAWARTGISNNSDVSARALAYVIGGHAAHHINIIKERYLTQ